MCKYLIDRTSDVGCCACSQVAETFSISWPLFLQRSFPIHLLTHSVILSYTYLSIHSPIIHPSIHPPSTNIGQEAALCWTLLDAGHIPACKWKGKSFPSRMFERRCTEVKPWCWFYDLFYDPGKFEDPIAAPGFHSYIQAYLGSSTFCRNHPIHTPPPKWAESP